METRKLQKVGGSTYAVSLPKEWATEHHLEAGMPIHLYPHTDGSLVVRSARDGEALGSTTISLPTADAGAVERALRAAYAVGYESVTLEPPDSTTFDAEERRVVRRFVQTMVGLSVTEESAERLTVETFLDASEVSIRQSVVQLQFVACAMHRTAVEAISGAGADRLAERDDEVDRLFAMLTRHFTRSLADFEEIDHLDVRRSTLFEYYLVAQQLERVADHAVRIGALADRIDPDEDVLAELTALASAARDVVETATSGVLELAPRRAHEALDQRDTVVDDVRALDRALFESAPPGGYALSRIVALLRRTAECGGNVATVALRSGVRPDA
ncbi:PhoU domain-containing protein [Haloplanus sp. C73]|uniref:PhoU domain-containing protein n=1 Tax=Haloplanus sp. C73 TaxID=3421641 RepID=UPI003EB83DF9